MINFGKSGGSGSDGGGSGSGWKIGASTSLTIIAVSFRLNVKSTNRVWVDKKLEMLEVKIFKLEL